MPNRFSMRLIPGAATGLRCFSLVLAAIAFMALHGASVAQATYEQSEAWFDVQSRDARLGLQRALSWTGDYDGPVDAVFGPQTYAALQALQARAGGTPDGVLTATHRSYLNAESARIQRVVNRHLGRQKPARVVRHRPAPVYAPAYRPQPTRVARSYYNVLILP